MAHRSHLCWAMLLSLLLLLSHLAVGQQLKSAQQSPAARNFVNPDTAASGPELKRDAAAEAATPHQPALDIPPIQINVVSLVGTIFPVPHSTIANSSICTA